MLLDKRETLEILRARTHELHVGNKMAALEPVTEKPGLRRYLVYYRSAVALLKSGALKRTGQVNEFIGIHVLAD